MFRKKIINASSNLKRSLDLGTKIKSNGCLHIGTEGVKYKKEDRLLSYLILFFKKISFSRFFFCLFS